jgi:hypothetical protein
MATPKPVLVEPKSISLEDVTVHVSLYRNGDEWWIEVILVRAPDQARVEAQDLTVELIGDQGKPLELRERPSGQLVEVGGNLGRSASGIFKFSSSGQAPAKIVVIYQHRGIEFSVNLKAS